MVKKQGQSNNKSNNNDKLVPEVTSELCFRFQSLNLKHVPDHSVQIYEFR